MAVNKELVRQVVEALRSGQYLQGHGALKYLDREDGTIRHCCIGVMEEVAGTPSQERVPGSSGSYVFRPHTDHGYINGEAVSMTPETAEMYGFEFSAEEAGNPIIADTTDGADVDRDRPLTAIEANDRWGWSFDQIADALEGKYLNG